jgi:hypothetical protein
MKEGVPGVSLTDLKRTTQRSQTGSAAGSVSEGQDGRQPVNLTFQIIPNKE